MKKKVKGIISIPLALILSLSLTLSSTLVYAADPVESLKDETSNLQTELSDLNSELNAICDELDSTITKMVKTTEDVGATRIALEEARVREAEQYEAMKLRIKYIYETGNTTFIEMLVTAESMADFLNKADFISSLSAYDRSMLEQLVEMQNEIALKEQLLHTEQTTLSSLKVHLDEKQAELTNKIASTSGELSVYQDRLDRAKAAALAAQVQLNNEVAVLPDGSAALPPVQPAPPDNSGSVVEPPMEEEEELPAPPPPDSLPATANEVSMLAALIECEAGGGSYDGLVAVGAVVLNRVRNSNYPNTIKGVIYQSGQFSPVASGKLDKVINQGASDVCYQAANDALSGSNPIGSCLNFRAASTGHSGKVVGGNVFF